MEARMPHWNDLTDEQRTAIIESVMVSDRFKCQVAIDVYNAIRQAIGEAK